MPEIWPRFYSERTNGASTTDVWARDGATLFPGWSMLTGDLVDANNGRGMDEAVVKELSEDTEPTSCGTGEMV